MNDPTNEICDKALTYNDVETGTSCNQTFFKAKKAKTKFLFIGPGAKGIGYKAMLKLDDSISQAQKLAIKEPDRYQSPAKAGWVTVRFTNENPIPKAIWEKWLDESYKITTK